MRESAPCDEWSADALVRAVRKFFTAPAAYNLDKEIQAAIRVRNHRDASCPRQLRDDTWEVLREIGARLGLSPGPFRLFLDGVILLAVILYLPNGLVSLPQRLKRWRPA